MINKLMLYYNNISKQVKASLWFIISNVIIKGIAFITLPIFSRILTTDEYGIVTVYQSWVSLMSIITTLTIWGGVFNVGMIKYEKRKYELISSFQGLAISLTFFFFIINFFLYDVFKLIFKMNGMLMICMYLEIMSQVPFNLWATEQRYKYEYKNLIFVSILMGLLTPVFGYIAVIHSSYRAEAKIVSNMIVQLIIGVIFFIVNQKKGKRFFCLEFWKFGFVFNIVLVPHYLSMQILNQSDRIMISNICGQSDAGIYGVAYNFAMLLTLITNGINSSLTPHIYQSLNNGLENDLKRQTTLIILLVAAIAVMMIVVIPEFFYLLLPSTYYPALKVIPPVVAGSFFLFLYPLFGSVEFYYKENKYVTIASVFGAIINIISNSILLRIFGFVAAAYTTLLCYISLSVFHYCFMKKTMNKRNQLFEICEIKKVIYISVFVVAISIIMSFFYEKLSIRLAIVLSAIVLLIYKRKTIIEVVKSSIQ